MSDAKANRSGPENHDFGIYVHWPFCAAKCPYCDFNSHVVRNVDQAVILEALCKELETYHRETEGRDVKSIFFGGGTPSLMEGRTLGGVLEKIMALWHLSADVEISMEANPTSVDAGRFADYASAGVGRLSLGIQALNDKDLVKLGRLHNTQEALAAIELANRNFSRVSFDLIYARPGQTEENWERELEYALSLGADHMSLYQLTFEEGTIFHALKEAGKIVPLDDDGAADLYDLTQHLCDTAGLPAYEVSNHAIPGQECHHNLIYWRMHDYIGVGPGAHGRFTAKDIRHGTEAMSDPAAWSKAVAEKNIGLRERQEVSRKDQATELMLMGLRLTEGVALSRYEALAEKPLDPECLHQLVQDDMAFIENGRLKVTSLGRPVLNSILAELLA
jgi:putative oxygen-independent coproporphyrinogen III oxidase